MKKYKNITKRDIEEMEILRIEKVLSLFLNDEYNNIIIMDMEDQKEFYRGTAENMPRECKHWMILSWDLQLVNGEPYICFNATWNDWD